MQLLSVVLYEYTLLPLESRNRSGSTVRLADADDNLVPQENSFGGTPTCTIAGAARIGVLEVLDAITKGYRCRILRGKLSETGSLSLRPRHAAHRHALRSSGNSSNGDIDAADMHIRFPSLFRFNAVHAYKGRPISPASTKPRSSIVFLNRATTFSPKHARAVAGDH